MTKSKQFVVLGIAVLLMLFTACGGKKEPPANDGEAPRGIAAKAKYYLAAKELKTLGTAIESYISDNDQSPDAKTIAQLEGKLAPFHIRVMQKTDPWGNPYHYKKIEPDGYAVGCSGYDGSFDGFEQEEGLYSADKLTGQDIIYKDGGFTLSPQATDPL